MSGFDLKTYSSCKLYNGRGKSGMVNLGNTCYFNSSVSALMNCLGLTHYFVSNSFTGKVDTKRPEYPFLAAYLKTLSALYEKNQVIKPKTLHNYLVKYMPQFEKGKQHDAYECIISIIDLLHRSLVFNPEEGPIDNRQHRHLYESKKDFSAHFKNDWSIMTELFFGQTIQKVKCLECKTVSFTYHPFMGINLPIYKKKNGIISIYELLKLYFSKQEITKDCESCKTCSKHSIKSRIIKLPKYLIIHFKRFDNNLDKKNEIIAFASSLDMSDHTLLLDGASTSYELMSVINHYNASMDTGHYNCMNRLYNGEWVCTDDSNVTSIVATDVCTKQAYVLIYEINEF